MREIRPRAALFTALVALSLTPAPGHAAEKRTAAVKIGTPAAELAFWDMKGNAHFLRKSAAHPSVYFFLSTQCPISNVYTPRINALAKTYSPRGVRVFGVYANGLESAPEIAQHAKEHHYSFPIVKDGGALAARLGAKMTPEAILLDGQGVIRYRGRIDDNQDPAQVTSHDLQNALSSVLANKPVRRTEARAFGCAIRTALPVAAEAKLAKVTYTRDVAPILQQNCQVCHRAGEVAPFALENYRQAANWAQQIKAYTANRKMPPWKADSHGEFYNERRLTNAQLATLAAWADAGAPQGDPKDLPTPPQFKSGWKLGEPDEVVQMPETYSVGEDGRDIYRCFVIPTSYGEDKWVSAVEVHPDNRRVVHHVIAYLDTSGTARKLDAADPGPGYTNPTPGNVPGFTPAGILAAWAPGNEPRLLPDGIGNLIPKGADIVLEVHYHKDGKPEYDRTSFGIYFSKKPVAKRMGIHFVGNFDFQIPANAENYVITASDVLNDDITVLGVAPHMHVVGRTMRAVATLPDKTQKQLVYVPDWDFNWQLTYAYKEPVKLPKGTRIDITATYDNTAKNPNNPNKPPKLVTYGEQTTNEMCLFGMVTTNDTEDLLKKGETKLAPHVLAAYTGNYEFAPGILATISQKGDKLFVKFPRYPAFEVYPKSETEFTLRIAPVTIKFVKDVQGKVEEFVVTQGGKEQHAKRTNAPALTELKEQTDPDPKLTAALFHTLTEWANDGSDLALMSEKLRSAMPATEKAGNARLLKEQKSVVFLKSEDFTGHEADINGEKAQRLLIYKLSTDMQTRYYLFYLGADGKLVGLYPAD